MMDFRDHNINSYLEQQYHGNVTVDCVESLTFPYDLTDKAKASMLEVAKKWQKTGAEVYCLIGAIFEHEENYNTLFYQ
ncbi:hypothetical protein [Fibrobacter sp.]|uniref:hypothetical protein n=1 Tax=Fibrobacter sp. TaxID=35828 RepID=UPI00388F5B49